MDIFKVVKNAARLRAIEHICQHSFTDYHAKGVDYLCLRFSPSVVYKVYFLPEVTLFNGLVNPHNHRYLSHTRVLKGSVTELKYIEAERGNVVQAFNWDTPLNGGEGFSWARETRLLAISAATHEPDCWGTYATDFNEIHTLEVNVPDTIIFQRQFVDEVPKALPTQTFVHGTNREPPSYKGFYNRMTPDRARELLKRLEDFV